MLLYAVPFLILTSGCLTTGTYIFLTLKVWRHPTYTRWLYEYKRKNSASGAYSSNGKIMDAGGVGQITQQEVPSTHTRDQKQTKR
jgi:hypothetical protein